MFVQILGTLALVGSCGAAWKWGGLDERLAALGFMLATIATNLVGQNGYGNTETGMLAIDALLFLGLLVIALRSDRFWPLWAAAFQLVATLVHFASMFETGNFAWAYYVALIFWTYPVFIALGAGTWFEARHRRNWAMLPH